MKVEFYKDKRKEWRWRMKAGNGKIIAVSSEGYIHKRSCKNAFNKVAEYTPEILVDKTIVINVDRIRKLKNDFINL